MKMKLLSNLVGEIGDIVETLSVSAKEKKEIQAGILGAVQRYDELLANNQSQMVAEEARGNWLQKSWRPIVMLVFAFIILLGTFTDLPILSDTSRLWDLLEIGIGGYVIGRSAEKVMAGVLPKNRKR